jgi:uncharacterized membrane protein YGL010W
METVMRPNPHPISGRSIDAMLAKYAASHRHPVNEIIHMVCVPAIVFALLGLVWAIHPLAAAALALASLLYYFSLSPPLAAGMLLMAGAMLALLYALPPGLVWRLSAAVFAIAWIGQFVGHRIEGKKPSFFDDIRFLLIGPLFVLGFLYRRLGVAY